jgi:hypothetical protein
VEIQWNISAIPDSNERNNINHDNEYGRSINTKNRYRTYRVGTYFTLYIGLPTVEQDYYVHSSHSYGRGYVLPRSGYRHEEDSSVYYANER